MATIADQSRPEARLGRYLSRHAGVDGWLDPYSAAFIAEIGRIQLAAGVAGAVAEIGVHAGRLFILLKLLAAAGEKALAIDIFADQHLNLDASGRGDEGRFRANLARWADLDGLETIHASSLEVRPAEILARVGGCRLFSIDGGHTEACAHNDLLLAEATTVEAGVAILDDYFNPRWPDVSTGAARYFARPGAALRPFAISPNKVYLARPAHHALYQRELRRTQRDYFESDAAMFGAKVLIFGVEAETWTPARRARRWLKGTALGESLVELRRRLRPTNGARSA